MMLIQLNLIWAKALTSKANINPRAKPVRCVHKATFSFMGPKAV